MKTIAKYYILQSNNLNDCDYYLKEEYSSKLVQYNYKIVQSFGKTSEPIESDLLLGIDGHKSSIEDLNEDLFEKLRNSFQDSRFQSFQIISDPADLELIDLDQSSILTYRNTKQLQSLGEETIDAFKNSDLTHHLISVFDKQHPGNGKNIFLGWLALLSSVMGNPIIVIVKGDPGTGKTQITNIIIDNIPSDHVIRLNNATEASLFGKANILGPDYPDRKIFYLGDLGDKKAIEHTSPYRKYLRELTSDGTTTREIADTNKPLQGHRPILTETLTGYPTMIYSTVRDEELEAQETDRAIEITPNLSQFKKIKEIILFHEDPDAKITKEIIKLQNEWTSKIQGIFEYLLERPQKVLLPWDLTVLNYGLRDTKTIASITRKIAMINQKSREKIDDYILASPVDLVLALQYIQDGELERTRLQTVYDHYGLSRSFTRDDVVAMFPDSYVGVQASKSAYRGILRPAVEDLDSEGISVLYEDRNSRPYTYYFRREPNKEVNFKVPPLDYSLIQK
jgi:hypothetical protein